MNLWSNLVVPLFYIFLAMFLLMMILVTFDSILKLFEKRKTKKEINATVAELINLVMKEEEKGKKKNENTNK